MRFLVATGGLLVLAGAIAARSRFGAEPQRQVVIREKQVEVSAEEPIAVSSIVEREAEAASVGQAPVGSAAPAVAPPPQPRSYRVTHVPRWSLLPKHQERILFLFDRQVHLSKDQRRHFADVFLSRQARIEAYQARITRSRVFDVPEYRVRIREMIGESYDQMAHVLDPQQQHLFYSIVAEGRLGDAVEFEMDPGLVVLQ